MKLKNIFFFKFVTILIFSTSFSIPNAMAYPDNEINGIDKIPIYPKDAPGTTAAGIEEFDWQETWGTIHMNTFADGLKDPGQPTTIDSNLACPESASLCNNDKIVDDTNPKRVDKITEAEQTAITHGIKYDIKNSVLNCMGRLTPNFPSDNNGWRHNYSAAVCDKSSGGAGKLSHPRYYSIPTIKYTPVWDPRGNDYRNTNTATDYFPRNSYAGCMQQISNSCANDVHECRLVPKVDGSGNIAEENPYEHPVTHSFYPREVKDLADSGMEGMKLPEKYYEYTKPGIDQHPYTRAAIKAWALGQDSRGSYASNILYLEYNGYETKEVQDLAIQLAKDLEGKTEEEIDNGIEEALSGLGEEFITNGNNVPGDDYIFLGERTLTDQPNPDYEACEERANAEQSSNNDVAAYVDKHGSPLESSVIGCVPETDLEWGEKWDDGTCGIISKITFKNNGSIDKVIPSCKIFSETEASSKRTLGECTDFDMDATSNKVRLADGVISSSKQECFDLTSNRKTSFESKECGHAFLVDPPMNTVADCANIPEKKDENVKVYRIVTSTRTGLSVVPNPQDMVLNKNTTYPVREIKAYDEDLARIKAYEVPVVSGDIAQFIIIDPQNFFDLRDYITGGRHDANYNQFDEDGNPATFDTCPILGLPNGYSGICDPKGKAGCNLPIYGVGAVTTFRDAEDREYTYNHFPIKWSGYVKSWKWLTVNEYKENTAGRSGQNGGNLYAVDSNDLNENLVLMTVRSNEYCDRRERYSGQIDPTKAPDLPCVQYWQYQNINPDDADDWSFVNLFMPEFDGAFETQYGYTYLDLFPILIKEDGTQVPYMKDIFGLYEEYGEDDLVVVQCDPTKDECKGQSNFVEVTGTTNRPVNFFDKNTQVDIIEADSIDETKGVKVGQRTAIDTENRGVYKESDELMQSNTGGLSIGEYIKDGDDSSGLHLKLKPGRVLAMRLMPSDSEKRNSEYDEQGNLVRASTRCVIAQDKRLDPEASGYFIPTNSEEEIEAFANATDDDIEIRPCAGSFLTFEQAEPPKPATNPNGTQTWFGETSCEQLTAKPACNQTKFISAERFCILEDGKLGDCEECMAAADPDSGIDFTLASVAPMGNAQILSVPGDEFSGSRCYFSAACFAQNGDGCPSAETSGGHVFCLSKDTKIQMADGTEKEIAKIKAGEKVMAFSFKASKKNGLITSKVVATAVTKDQEYRILTTVDRISGKETVLRITPQHKVVLSSGRGVEVRDLRAGVPILDASGRPVLVKSVTEAEKPITVYNLILEDHADGYIAGNLRVLSYPLLDGIKANLTSQVETKKSK